jgi:hypothetical protein
MKWLATAFLCLLAMPALAEDNLVRLPTVLWCGPYNPEVNDREILEKYGEIPFVEGDGEVMTPDPTMSYQGKIRMFLDPNDYSYSIFLDINEELTCLVTTGERINPFKAGNGI